ncbi:hypothetical protein ACFVSS_25790 [Peribacillus butanolivorans]|uniref:hypothetical protein n=1 Tax=Peribacillus butanolivorans TaxID=421767 RepID=UPI0036DF78E6
MRNKYETRYFYIISLSDDKFIQWNTVKGILNEDIVDDYEIITDLMVKMFEISLGKNMKFGI